MISTNALDAAICVALLVLVNGFALTAQARSDHLLFDRAAWDLGSSVQKEEFFAAILKSGELPIDNETVPLKWFFAQSPTLLDAELVDNLAAIPDLPLHLSATVLELARAGETVAAQRCLEFARDRFPNNSDVLAAHGILLAWADQMDAARILLDRASQLGQQGSLTDFHLGTILIQSKSAVDRTRGKVLLLGLLEGPDVASASQAGLAVLINPRIYLSEGEISRIYQILLSEESAYEFASLGVDVLRLLIGRILPFMPAEAFQLSSKLVELQESTVEDRIEHIRLARQTGNTDGIAAHLNAISKANKEHASPRSLRLLQMEVAILRIRAGRYEEAYGILLQLVDTTADADALAGTFKTILSSALLPAEESKFLELFLRLPVRDLPSSLIVLGRLLETYPERRDEWIQYAVDHLLDVDPVWVTEWLLRFQAGDAVLGRFQSLPAHLLSAEQSVALLNLLLWKGDLETARQVLDAHGHSLLPGFFHLLDAQLLFREQRTDEAESMWYKAREAIIADGRYHLLKPLGTLALEMDRPKDAYGVLFDALSAGTSFSEVELQRLNELAVRHGTLQQAIRVATQLLQTAPDIPVYQNNLAYFRFLANQSTEVMVNSMRPLVEEYPEIVQYRLTLALGLLRSGRHREAQNLLEASDIDWNNTSPQGRLIYAAILTANDQQSVAEVLSSQLDPEDFITEEKALLEGIRSSSR